MKFVGPSSKAAIDAPTDIFGRDQFANGLFNIFKTSDDPLVIALDDEWGTGKTVFARRMGSEAVKTDVKAIYYDAFKRDYNPDVFVSLVAEIIALEPKAEKTKELKEKAIGVAKVIGKTLLKGGIRLATAGAINSSGIDEATKGIANEVGDTVEGEFDKFIDERLSNAAKDEMSFDAFRNSLSELVQKNDKGEIVPLLFIIDELDRCRPDHALELLETIKHLFSVPNVHFLLVTNLTQMRASVNKRYGQNIDANLYLEKFIDLKVSFPKKLGAAHENALAKFIASIVSELPDDKENDKYKSVFVKYMQLIAMERSYSFRRIERICTVFAVCLNFSHGKNFRLAPIVHILCDMKISNPSLFEVAKRGELNFDQLKNSYPFLRRDRSGFDWYAKWWEYCLASEKDAESDEWRTFGTALWEWNIDRKEIVTYLANEIVEPMVKN